MQLNLRFGAGALASIGVLALSVAACAGASDDDPSSGQSTSAQSTGASTTEGHAGAETANAGDRPVDAGTPAVDAGEPAADAGEPSYFACDVSSDCVALPLVVHCCNNGWKIAVATCEVAAYQQANQCDSRQPMCPEYIVDDTRVAACNAASHQCVMVAP